MRNWWQAVLSGEIPLHLNSCKAFLVEKAIQRRQGLLSNHGALVKKSENKNSSKDPSLYFIPGFKNPVRSLENLNAKEIHEKDYEDLKIKYLKKIHFLKAELFLQESIIEDDKDQLSVHFLTTSPVHALLFDLLTKKKSNTSSKSPFIFFHDPDPDLENLHVDAPQTSITGVNLLKHESLITGVDSLLDLKEKIFKVLGLFNLNERGRNLSFSYFHSEGFLKEDNYFGAILENVILDEKTREPLVEGNGENSKLNSKLDSNLNLWSF